ncbi:pyocin knob domain-containing protein [Paraclostridium bifermentans]|uniref:pyocin knob domain-containing protein n=1 Tax=Paraclostridium bifermentans TaxID=1490 RepID=UPI00359C6C8C
MSSYKTNWQLTETVMPEDMNRIEQNVKDNNKNHTDFKTEYDKTLKEQNKKIDGKSEKSDVVFKVPKRLSATTDLNTICTGGNYVVLPNTPNSPNSGKYGRLVVYQWDNSGKWITQVFYTDGVNEVYTRCSLNDSATSWTPWQKLLNINEGDSRYFRTYIDGISTDFNNAKTQGIYHVSGDFENSPQEGHVYGVLEVIARDKHRTQRFTDINNNVWNRFYNSGSNSWTSWSKIYSESNKPTWNDVQNKPNSFPPSNHNHDDRYVNKDLGIVTDFNLCTKTGIYKVANPQPFKNGPSGCSTYGELEVYEYTSGVECLQRYTDANSNIYTRFKNSSTWRNWQKFYSENNKPTWNEINDRPDTYPPSTHNHDDRYGRYIRNVTFGGNDGSITTVQFIELLKNLGAFTVGYWVGRGTWSYANNQYIHDTGCGGLVHLAGSVVEVISSTTDGSSQYTIRITTPSTSGHNGCLLNCQLEYVNNGSSYNPMWTKVFNTDNKPGWSDITEKPNTFPPSSHSHDDRYYTESEANSRFLGKNDKASSAKIADSVNWNNISGKPGSFPPSSHDHDSKYLQYNRGNIGSSSDFNNATAVGVYGVGYDNTIPNAPVSGGLYGVLEVLSKPNELIQRVTSSSGDIWIRLRNWQGVWASWHKLTKVEDFVGVYGESGFQKLPSGLLIQWGRHRDIVPKGGWSKDGTFAFPIAFKALYSAVATVTDCNSGNSVWGEVSVRHYTNDSLKYTILDRRTQVVPNDQVYAFDWIAIGLTY